jgi:hypothetical protein
MEKEILTGVAVAETEEGGGEENLWARVDIKRKCVCANRKKGRTAGRKKERGKTKKKEGKLRKE